MVTSPNQDSALPNLKIYKLVSRNQDFTYTGIGPVVIDPQKLTDNLKKIQSTLIVVIVIIIGDDDVRTNLGPEKEKETYIKD